MDPQRDRRRERSALLEVGERDADHGGVPRPGIGELDRDEQSTRRRGGAGRFELGGHILPEDLARARQRQPVADGQRVDGERAQGRARDECDDPPMDLEAAGDGRRDREEGVHAIRGHPGLVE